MITRIKESIVKKKNRKNRFREIGIPPEPAFTRCGSWLKAAMYYADNLPRVRNIFNDLTGSGMLLTENLLIIIRDYECLIELFEKSENLSYTRLHEYNDLTTTDFGIDSCNILFYVNKCLQK